MRVARSVLLLLSTSVFLACGGSAAPAAAVSSHSPTPSPAVSPSPATAIGAVSLTNAGCSYKGPGTVATGRVSVSLKNQANAAFGVDVWQLQAGHPYRELVAHIKEEQRRIAAHEGELGYPTFASLVHHVDVAKGSTTDVVMSFAPAVYGFVCFRSQPDGMWLAGPVTAK